MLVPQIGEKVTARLYQKLYSFISSAVPPGVDKIIIKPYLQNQQIDPFLLKN